MAQEAFGGDSFGNSRPGSPSGSFHYYGQGSSKKHAPVQRDWAFSGYSSVEDVVAEITQGKDENDFIGQAFLHNNNFYIMAPNKQGYLVAQRRGILEGSEIYDISNQNRVLVYLSSDNLNGEGQVGWRLAAHEQSSFKPLLLPPQQVYLDSRNNDDYSPYVTLRDDAFANADQYSQ